MVLEDHVREINELDTLVVGVKLMRHLILMNYFSKIIGPFADIAKPLYDVLKSAGLPQERKRNCSFSVANWNQRWKVWKQKAWRELEKFLSNPQILALPRKDEQIKVVDYASAYRLGSVLSQSCGVKR